MCVSHDPLDTLRTQKVGQLGGTVKPPLAPSLARDTTVTETSCCLRSSGWGV